MEDLKIIAQAVEQAALKGAFGNKDNYIIHVAIQNIEKALKEAESLKTSKEK